jgi:F0F1-type ATP synthase epsilon subunit
MQIVNTFKLRIITPHSSCPTRNASSLNVPAENGRLTVLAGHQPMICLLTGGIIKFADPAGNPENWSTGPGTMAVEHNQVTLLLQDFRTEPPPQSQ